MAGYNGIAKINGVAIGSISKMTGRTKQGVWNISSAPRQENLFKTLIDVDWGSYTQGGNFASFVAVGTTTAAYVSFAVGGHTSGDTYNFTFDKTGVNTDRTIALRISTDVGLVSIIDGADSNISLNTGAVSTSLSASTSNSNIYIGFRKVSPSYTGTLTIDNLVVTRS